MRVEQKASCMSWTCVGLQETQTEIRLVSQQTLEHQGSCELLVKGVPLRQ